MLEPIQRKSLPDAVFDQIAGQITDGTLAAGDALPGERDLAERLGVNRGAVREALKRLSQAKLVRVRQGGKSTVLDYRRNAGLDLLSRLLLRADGSLNIQVARSVLALRAALAPEVVRAAAASEERCDCAASLRRVIATMEDEDDLAVLQDLAMDFWQALVDAGGNIAFALAFNTLRETYDKLREPLAPALAPELRAMSQYNAIADAVQSGQGEEAAGLAGDLVRLGGSAIENALSVLEALS